MPKLVDLLEGFAGADAEQLNNHINNRAKELGLKLFLDDGEKNIFVPKARLDAEIVKVVELKKTIAEQQADIKKVKDLTADNEKAQDKIKDYENKFSDMEAKMRENNLALALKMKASELKAVDETGQDLLKFIDKDKLDVKDDGTVIGLDEALKSLKASKSYLFQAETTDDKGAGNGAQPGSLFGTGFTGRPPVNGLSNHAQKPGAFGASLSSQVVNNIPAGQQNANTQTFAAPTYDFFK